MSNIIYKITYKPHLHTDFPKYYIGSKYKWKGNYYGSVSSTQKFHFTQGQKLSEWWKTRDTNDFLFEILVDLGEESSKDELIERERQIQLDLNVKSAEYFNQCVANKGFFSCVKSEETRKKMSESLKAFYKTKKGLEKRKNVSEMNSKIKSRQVSEKWKNPTKAMLSRKKAPGKVIEYDGKVYESWSDFKKATGISRYKYLKLYPDTIINEVKFDKKIVKCPHCLTSGSGPAMKRWHFDKCKEVKN